MSLEQLWKLQEIDLFVMALEKEAEQILLKEELQDLVKSVERLEAVLAADEEQLEILRRRLKSLELDLQKNTENRVALRKRLYGGVVSNVRELEQMEIKLKLLEKEQSIREDEALEIMEKIERGDLSLQAQNSKLQAAMTAQQIKERQIAESLDQINLKLALLKTQQKNTAAQIELPLLERYRLLAQKYQGRGLARVIHDICGGCRVFISSAQRGFLFNPQAMVYCESCGRLLVKLPEPTETG